MSEASSSEVIARAPISRVISAAVWLLAIAALLEMTFRLVVFPDYSTLLQDMYVRHPVFGHFNKPNLEVRRYNPLNYDVVDHTNSHGFRGIEADMSRELSGIWILGDSNVFGGYVADGDTFARRLRDYGYWAANLASEGHGTANQVLVLRDTMRQGFKPKAVILGVSFFNVLRDYDANYGNIYDPLPDQNTIVPAPLSARQRLVSALTAAAGHLPEDAVAVRSRLLKNSAFYGWVKVSISNFPAFRQWTLDRGWRTDVDLAFGHEIDMLRPLTPENPVTHKVASTADYIAAVARWIGETENVPFGVVLLPNHHQIYPDRFERLVRYAHLEGQDVDPVRVLSAVADALRERGINVLDPLPALQTSHRSDLTFPDDGHLTAEGHRIMADLMANWVKTQLNIDHAP